MTPILSNLLKIWGIFDLVIGPTPCSWVPKSMAASMAAKDFVCIQVMIHDLRINELGPSELVKCGDYIGVFYIIWDLFDAKDVGMASIVGMPLHQAWRLHNKFTLTTCSEKFQLHVLQSMVNASYALGKPLNFYSTNKHADFPIVASLEELEAWLEISCDLNASR